MMFLQQQKKEIKYFIYFPLLKREILDYQTKFLFNAMNFKIKVIRQFRNIEQFMKIRNSKKTPLLDSE